MTSLNDTKFRVLALRHPNENGTRTFIELPAVESNYWGPTPQELGELGGATTYLIIHESNVEEVEVVGKLTFVKAEEIL